MRKRFLLPLLVLLMTTLSIHAYDFQSGDLYYNITSDTTVEVTCQEEWSENNYQGLTTATIPATVTNDGTTYSVTSIGYGAFLYCSALTSITIPNSVTSIGYNAFYECTALPVVDNLRYADTYLVEAVDKSLSIYTIKAGTKWIGISAFEDCSSLTSITIPNSVTSIGRSAFAWCSSLTSLTLPNSVTSIGKFVCWCCASLTSIVVESGNTMYDSRDNCNAIIETATNTLIAGCQSTTIPNSVTSIESNAFEYCSSLTSITIPNSVTSIGDYAFGYCSSLTSITCLAQTPPTCENYCFKDVPRTIPLYVPAESVEAYKAAAVWQEFNIIGESNTPTAIETTKSTDTKGVQKLLRNGQVLILRNGETYDMMGKRL